MKFRLLTACAVGLFAGVANASPITLIDYTTGASSPGNGAFFSDPSGTVIAAAQAVNPVTALNTNTNGRALRGANQNENLLFDNLNAITNNIGVEFAGWGVYRWRYEGGNDALGLLENGGRLGKANATNDGQVFANSSDYVLVSDPYSPADTAAGDTFDISALVGADTGGGTDSFTLSTYLVLDDTTFVLADSRTITGNPDPDDLSLTEVGIPSSYTTVRLVLAVDGSSGVRGLIDDVRLIQNPVPEPGAVILSMMALVGVGAVGMRRRLG